MNSPIYLVKNLLDINLSINELKTKLYSNKILMKDYEQDNIILLYRKFNSYISNEIDRECRSIIINRTTYEIIADSCEFPREKIDNLNLFNKSLIYSCYEGPYLTLFYFNNKWNVSSRKIINESKNINLFYNVIENFKDEFYTNLNIEHTYNFILIHHENKYITDYNKIFGSNYKKICLTTIRDKNLVEINLDTFKLNNNFIFISQKISEININDSNNDNLNILKYLEDDLNKDLEGIIIKVWNNETNKYNLIKFQNDDFKYKHLSNINSLHGMLFLYKINKLSKTVKIGKYAALGCIDLLFKNLSMHIFDLFKLHYNMENGKALPDTNYSTLHRNYKNILYNVRGIFFSKKSHNIPLTNNDIYYYLKTLDTTKIISLINTNKKEEIFKNDNSLFNLIVNLI